MQYLVPDDTRSVAPALRLFLWSRAAIWLLALVAVVGFDGALNARRGEWDSARLHDLGVAIDVWARWDSDWFLRIAENGYSWPSSTPAFFPLYPFLVAGARLGAPRPRRARGRRRLARGRRRRVRAALPADPAPARRGGGATHGALPRGRSDLAVLRRGLQRVALPAARGGGVPRRRAGAVLAGRARVAGLALLTRSAGVALLPALVVLAWRAPDRRRALAGVGGGAAAVRALSRTARRLDRPAARVPRGAEGRLGASPLAGRARSAASSPPCSSGSCSTSGSRSP